MTTPTNQPTNQPTPRIYLDERNSGGTREIKAGTQRKTLPALPLTNCSPLLTIKVKRWEYQITEADKFMDNGACVQLLTQSKQRDSWARKITPKLSKQAIKQISRFKRIPREHPNAVRASVFSLENASTLAHADENLTNQNKTQ